jgi:carboxyl-terminal processing protease
MPKSVKISLVIVASVILLTLSFAAGCVLTMRSSTAGLDTGLINQAWEIITRNYVEPDSLDPTTVTQGAIKGMVQALDDPYSYYLTPSEYQVTQGNFQSSFGGIGATISMNEDREPVIVNTIEGAPASKSGLRPEDVILAVNDESTEGLTVDQVVSKVRGPIGTKVKLTIIHADEKLPVDIEIERAEINLTTVEYSIRGDVAYIQITNFYESTNKEFQAALEALDLENARGIILDLRNNLGGYVNTMVEVASHFIKEGTIITLRDNQGRTDSESVRPNGIFTDLPLVVLVNQYSASASEVLSGALQDYDRAVIAGTQTFGKGSYDVFYTLGDGSAIYLTVGRWLTPQGREIEGVGITPDQVREETGDDLIQWGVDFLTGSQP